MPKALSLAVVGADYPNKKGPGRRFEIELCAPGDPIALVPEPKNPKDPRAIMVMSERGVQIGYVTAERCGWIGALMGEHEVRAVFQRKTSFGAWIRLAFDGEEPTLPAEPPTPESHSDPDSGFYPDEVYPDE